MRDKHALNVSCIVGGIVALCSCGWTHTEKTSCRPQAWTYLESAWNRHAESNGLTTTTARRRWLAVVEETK